ncbi:MAG: hypothetical protein K0B05_09670 [Bacteroidales bacterium]|nr:hypothetical protein [Bacteroidales bacterium]
MERKIYTLILMLMLMGISEAVANYKADIYSSYISGDMDKWKAVIDRLEEIRNKDNALLLELVNYQYGYIGWALGVKRNSEARRYLNLAEANLAVLERNKYSLSMVNAYKTAFYGYRIGLNVLQAPFVGPKSLESARMAKKLDPSNPFGYIQHGNAVFYMPERFGGSRKEGIENFLKAEALMEKNPAYLDKDWNYLSLLTIIAQAYTELEEFDSSKVYYEKILKIEPGFTWVKNELYRDLLQKMKN